MIYRLSIELKTNGVITVFWGLPQQLCHRTFFVYLNPAPSFRLGGFLNNKPDISASAFTP
jgi:hypothetical protein